MASSGEEDVAHVQRMLSRIESFLLPKNSESLHLDLSAVHANDSGISTDASSKPFQRLDETLNQLSIADHIRTLQTVYRDQSDDHCLARELRNIDLNIFLDDERDEPPAYEHICTRDLLEKILEGRSRACALTTICYGEHSLARAKAEIDLANVYALQGRWSQAEERIVKAMTTLTHLQKAESESVSTRQQKRSAVISAQRIVTVFSSLREHVSRHGGFAGASLADELQMAFADVLSSDHPDHILVPHPSSLINSLREFLLSSSAPASNDERAAADSPTKNKHSLKQLSQSYFHDADNAYLRSSNNTTSTNSIHLNRKQTGQQKRSWGQVVQFLRSNDCPAMVDYCRRVEQVLLPQIKAALLLPFSLCDVSRRNLANTSQIISSFRCFPSTAKLIFGDGFVNALKRCQEVVPLVVNAHTGSVQNLHKNVDAVDGNNAMDSQRVAYELPVTVEEYLSHYVLAQRSLAIDDVLAYCTISALVLQGICSINLSQWSIAEEALSQALQSVESLSLDSDVFSCDLYNAIAQMMICKHTTVVQQRRSVVKQEAELWTLHSDEGKRAVRVQTKKLKKAENDLTSAFTSHAEFEYRAKELVMKDKAKQLLEFYKNDGDAHRREQQSLEAAQRYLAKSLEIIENAHGNCFPLTAAACLAIASVQNLRQDYEDTREWLLKALRIFEKASQCSDLMFFPLPDRAMAFAHTQLAQVLVKLQHEDEARRVQQKAVDFFIEVSAHSMRSLVQSKRIVNIDGAQRQRATAKIANRNSSPKPLDQHPPHRAQQIAWQQQAPETARSQGSRASLSSEATKRRINPRERFTTAAANPERENTRKDEEEPDALFTQSVYNLVLPVILKGSSLDEDIAHTMHLSSELVRMLQRSGEYFEASQQCARVCQLVEKCFGWDSVESAEAHRDLCLKYLAIKDYTQAMRIAHKAAEAFVAVFGKADPRVAQVLRLYAKAKSGKMGNGDTSAEEHKSSSNIGSGEQLDAVLRKDADLILGSAEQTISKQAASAIAEIEKHIQATHINSPQSRSLMRSIEVHQEEVMHRSARNSPRAQIPSEEYSMAEHDFYPSSPVR